MPFASHRGALSEQWLVDRSTSPTATAYAQSSTPSTRYTESPFSHVPTPSSASSYSSAAVASNVSPVGNRQQSPVRSRRLASDVTATQLALPPVRKSSTSSSNATVKPGSIKVRPENRHANALPAAKGYAATTTASRTKQQPTGLNPRTTAAPIQVPPEFLHLHVDLPTQASASLHKPPPPLRPSRENTPSITDMRSAASVIRSDLPRLLTTYHKRTPSLETPVSPSAPSPGFKARLGFSSRSSSRQESPRIDSAVSASSSDRNTLWSRSPDAVKAATPERRRLRRRDSPAVESEANPSKSPRFGIFSRKPKTESVKTTEKPKRQSTRGPTAGTGHEGYGRFGFRGRSGSFRSSTNDFRSPSVDSNVSSVPSHDGTSREGSATSSTLEVGLDDFLRKLQAPRVLRGSGKPFSTGDSTHEILETSMAEPSSSSSVDSYPRPQLLPSAMNAGALVSPRKRPSLATRVPSDSSEDDAAARFAAGIVAKPHRDDQRSAKTLGQQVPIGGVLAGSRKFDARRREWLRRKRRPLPATSAALNEQISVKVELLASSSGVKSPQRQGKRDPTFWSSRRKDVSATWTLAVWSA
ncbi:nascent polypeptide-associated complex subunit alpha, muscle-specific form-like [Teratosphaeria destructans]|uniref:Nascent polypeptide-associated complex subunit alpha, muscle-specific form-like n=1 Tax=Teratosphaeria destructans TaxID=418781 RepID=A0A9W7W042_9PEZI|nr:nascent polypeptide-associated complex subunit alpha, muscle-specific form-like [Teratosphaeria destructans]